MSNEFQKHYKALQDLPKGDFFYTMGGGKYIVGNKNAGGGISYFMVYNDMAFTNHVVTGTSDDEELLKCHLNEFIGCVIDKTIREERLDLEVARTTSGRFFLLYQGAKSRKMTRISGPDARNMAGHFFCSTLTSFPEDYKPTKVYKVFDFYVHFAGDKSYISYGPNSPTGYLVTRKMVETLIRIASLEDAYELARIATI